MENIRLYLTSGYGKDERRAINDEMTFVSMEKRDAGDKNNRIPE